MGCEERKKKFVLSILLLLKVGDQMLRPYIIQTDFKDVLSSEVLKVVIMRLLVTLVQPLYACRYVT